MIPNPVVVPHYTFVCAITRSVFRQRRIMLMPGSVCKLLRTAMGYFSSHHGSHSLREYLLAEVTPHHQLCFSVQVFLRVVNV